LKFKLDENIPTEVVAELNRAGPGVPVRLVIRKRGQERA
jgi:hypothetical protein